MADTVASQTVLEGRHNLVMKFTNSSDGTGESAVTKVDVSGLSPACDEVAIEAIHYTTQGMGIRLLWDADTDVTAFEIAADQTGTLDLKRFGGLLNNAGTGKTGDIKLTTVGHSSGDSYTLILEMRKKGVA